ELQRPRTGKQQLVVRSRLPRRGCDRPPYLPVASGGRTAGVCAFQPSQQQCGDDGDLRFPGGALWIMRAPANLCRRFVASTRAVAAIEFSIVLPVLMLIF